MESVNLSILVVSCKDYKPSHNWYLRRSDGCFYGTAKSSDDCSFDETRLEEFNSSEDYVLMPECPKMTDEDVAKVIKGWCHKNSIPYNDDMDRIGEAYRSYYDY